MAETFDPGPLNATLDDLSSAYQAARGSHRPDHADIFEARVAQLRALFEETKHHIENVVPFVVPDTDSQAAEIAALQAQIAALTAGKED